MADIPEIIIGAVLGALGGKTTHIAATIMPPVVAADAARAYCKERGIPHGDGAGDDDEIFVWGDERGVVISPGPARTVLTTPPFGI